MANKNLFKQKESVTTLNRACGYTYKLDSANALCQYVVTSTFNDAYYSSADQQLKELQGFVNEVDSEIIAKAAIYGREVSHMKDTPAYLCAVLAARGELDLLSSIFNRVLNNPKMLLNFVQIVRSGVTGRKSFGTAIKRMIAEWITSKSGDKLFLASIGKSSPSLADVVKMVHPLPANDEQSVLFAYLLGGKVTNTYPYKVVYETKKHTKTYNFSDLPKLVQEFEWFKYDNSYDMPDLDYRALINCQLTTDHWKQIAKNMPWNALRLNLNVLNRNGVFEDENMIQLVASKLRDEELIRKYNAFPYQLLTSYQNTKELPTDIRLALQDAMEIATENVPELDCNVVVCVDVSGSMGFPITGYRSGSTSNTACKDVASLVASSIIRTNPKTKVVSYATKARIVDLNPRDSVMTNASILMQESSYCGHGTSVNEAMRIISSELPNTDLVIVISDMQTWNDSYGGIYGWSHVKNNNQNAKMVEINLQPYNDSHSDYKNKDVLCFGGWSDAMFDILKSFVGPSNNINFIDIVSSVKI